MNGPIANTRSATIRSTVEMTMVNSTFSRVITHLSYRTMDPFAVALTFSVPDCPAVEWVCARDLLREGLALPSGNGDVRVSPDGDDLVIELLSPSGNAQLLASYSEIGAFVDRMLRAVPEGRESEFYSLDTELEFLV